MGCGPKIRLFGWVSACCKIAIVAQFVVDSAGHGIAGARQEEGELEGVSIASSRVLFAGAQSSGSGQGGRRYR